MRLVACLIVAVGTMGCSSSAPEGTWITRLGGGQAWLGITVSGEDGAAFVCGQEEALDTHTRWMLTKVTEEEATFVKDGWTLEVTLSEGNAAGELVDPSGVKTGFDAPRAGSDDLRGLYFSFDSGCGDGLIVLDGSSPDAPEALGAWCSSGGEREQVIPVLPMELTNQGIAVTVDAMAGTREFFMTRAVASTVTP